MSQKKIWIFERKFKIFCEIFENIKISYSLWMTPSYRAYIIFAQFPFEINDDELGNNGP